MDILSQRIKALRKSRGWSQNKLAHVSGLTSGHVSQIESGKRRPTLTSAIALATALGVNIDALLTNPQPQLDTVATTKEAA